MKIGDKVTVKIPSAKLDEWAHGAAESLNGCAGTVEKVGHDARQGQLTYSERRVLVAFDVPAKPWSSNQQAVKAFWFDRDEVELTR